MSERPDLSKDAIRRAVLGGSLQHPAVVYPAALGVLGGVGATLLATSPAVVGTAIAAGGLAAVGFAVNFFFRRDWFAGEYLARAHEAIVKQREVALADVEDDLKRYGAEQAIRQLERMREKIATFQEVLGEKLKTTEITYGRFLGIAEQVFLSGVDNLRSIALAHAAMDAVDESYINGRIRELERNPKRSKSQTDELDSLNQQLQNRHQQDERAQACLAQNERALLELDRAIGSVSQMKTGSQGAVDMEAAMAELARVAARAKDYESR